MSDSYSVNNENYIGGDKKPKLVSFMRDKFKDLTDTLSDKNVYELAQDYFPQYDYEDWNESEYDYDYASSYEDIDISPDSLNSVLHTEENLKSLIDTIPQEKFEKAMDNYYKENPEAKIRENPLGSLPDKFQDPFAAASELTIADIIMPIVNFSDKRKRKLKQQINERTAGLNHRIRTGEDKYKIDDTPVMMGGTLDYDESIGEGIGNTILGTGVSDIAGWIGAGKIMKMVNPRVGSTILNAGIKSKYGQWVISRTPDFIKKTLPNSKLGIWMKNNIFKNFDRNKAADQMFNIGQINAMIHTHQGVTQSVADQLTNRGKYKDNNGTISIWDTTIDAGTSYAEGVAVGTAVGFTNNVFDSAWKHSSKLWLKSPSFRNTIQLSLTSPVSKYASHGITYTSMPLIWDKERRAQYIDDNGNIKFGKYWADVGVMSGYSLALVGTSQALGYTGQAKKSAFAKGFIEKFDLKKVKLNKNEMTQLKKKHIESQRAAAGKGEKDVAFDEWLSSLDKGKVANLIKGKEGISVSLKEKLLATFGVRPTMPWNRNSKMYSEPLPSHLSLPETLRNIKKQVKSDITYETNKKTNTNLQTNEQKMLNDSKNSISGELKGKVPYEFYEETVNDLSKDVDMGNGLKSIYDIATESLRIIDKISITDNQGKVIGVDHSKATDEDLFFLQAYAPSVIPAYQGYKDTYLGTDEGKDAYIKRYENEKGITLNNKQKKLLIDVAINQNNQLDVIRDYLNRRRTTGFSESEQIIVKDKNVKPELSPEFSKVILLDKEGLPITGEVLSIDKAEAQALIEAKRAMTVSFAKNNNIDTFETDNKSVGNKNIEAIEDAVLTPKLDTKIKQGQFKSWIKELDAKVDAVTYKTISVGNNILQTRIEEMVNNKGNREIPNRVIEGINDVIDIKVISQFPDAMLKKMKEHNINRLLIHAGKDSFSEITTDDIVNYFQSRVDKKRAAGEMPALSDPERSAFFNFFKALDKKGAVLENPYDKSDKRIKNFTSDFNTLRAQYKKENVKVFDFFKNVNILKDMAKNIQKISNIKKLSTDNIQDLKQISKDTKIPLKVLKEDKGRIATVLELFYKTPVRDQEINVIRPDLVIQNLEDGTWYIDLALPRRLGGARKSRGTPRPLPITESIAKKILLHGKEFGMDKEIFSNHSDYITKLLAHTLGKGNTAKQFKAQLKTIAQGQAGLLEDAPFITSEGIELFINEKELYGVIAGHKTAKDDQISKYYTEKQNYADFFAMAKQVMDKVNSRVDEMMKPTTPVIVEPKAETPTLGKVTGKVLKAGEKVIKGPILSIKDISNKSDKDVVNIVSEEQPIKITKTFLNKYRKSVIKEFNRQTGPMSQSNKEERLLWFAQKSGIKDFTNFDLKTAEFKDLMAFSQILLTGTDKIVQQKLSESKKLDIINKAEELADKANISMDERRDILKLKFRKTNRFDLTLEEAKAYRTEMALNQDVKEFGVWNGSIVDENTFLSLIEKIPLKTSVNIAHGTGGQFKTVMYMLEDKYGIKGAKFIADSAINHVVWENEVQNYLTQFETEAIYALADDKFTLNPRQVVGKYNIGKKRFEKIKKHIWWMQEDQWSGLKKFVETYPEHKDVADIYNEAKKFMDNIYDKDGNLRIDTPESQVAKAWHNMTERIKDSYIRGLKANMTEMQYNKFMKDHGIKWIENTFYMTKSLTPEFIEASDLNNVRLLKEVEKNVRPIAIDRAIEKHGKNPTAEQIKAEEPAAKIEALNTLANKMNYSTQSKTQARYLLERQLNLPPFLIVKGKPVQVWETAYASFAERGVAGQGKISATIRWFPYFADIKGLPGKFRHMPEMIAELHRTGGNPAAREVGRYIKRMLHSRIGILKDERSEATKRLSSYMAQGSHFLNKAYLSFYLSAVKNAGLGSTMNTNIWADEARDLAVNMARALDFENRLELKGKGIISLSLSAIETEGKLANLKINEWLFKKGGFKQSEEFTRAVASLMALTDCPKMADVLDKAPVLNHKLPASSITKGSPAKLIDVINKATEIYDLNDEEIYRLQQYGLSDPTDFILDKNISLETFDGKVLTSSYDKANEINAVYDLHQKMITMAHINSQGATADIFQHPIFLTKGTGQFFQFQKMAVSWMYNIKKVYRMNKKNKNALEYLPKLFRVAGTHTMGHAAIGKSLLTLGALWSLIPNEEELDDKWNKKILRWLMKGEVIGPLTPLMKLGKGEMPAVTDFVTMVPYVTLYELISGSFDIVKGIRAAVTGKTRKGSTALEQAVFDYEKFPSRNAWDMAWGINTFMGSVLKIYTNVKHPYNLDQKEIKKWEKAYLNTGLSTRANITTATPMNPWNDYLKRSFNQSDNHRETATRMVEKYIAQQKLYKAQGYDDITSQKMARAECEKAVDRLCPLSIGTNDEGRVLNISRDVEFIQWLMKRTINQIDKGILKKNDPLVHVNKLMDTVEEWRVKKDSLWANVDYLIRKDERFNKDGSLKELHKVQQTNLEDLGFTVGDDGKITLDPRVFDAIQLFKKQQAEKQKAKKSK